MNGFNFFNKWMHKPEKNAEVKDSEKIEESSDETLERYKLEMGKIEINNEPFQLRGLLHLLTNNISKILKKNRHDIYYDIDSYIGRYIIGDNYYIGEVLEIILRHISELNTESEIILKLDKSENNRLVFEISNKKGYFNAIQKEKNEVELSKAEKIAEAMKGKLTLKSNRFFGTTYIFEIPFYRDRDYKSYKDEIKEVLKGKKALFIGKNAYDTKRAQYIFKTYGIEIENMEISVFETKKPNMSKFDMAILRSQDLNPKHIIFFRNIRNNPESKFKIILVHELFESKEKIAISKEIAHAELYNPTVIGDVEEILYQMFILKSHAVEHIDNIHTFDVNNFRIKESKIYKKSGLRKFRGANIAIVEDSKPNRKIIDHILTLEDIKLFHVNNGQEMIDLLKEKEINFIFSDINMPVMDGLNMTKKIRENKLWREIPIVSISSMQFEHELKEMYFAGMNGSIPKPFKENYFYAALEEFLVPTEAMKLRVVKEKKQNFTHNRDILDIERGIKSVESELVYKEVLIDTMQLLQGTTHTLEELIYNKNFIELGRFARTTLRLYENMFAPEMSKIFKELLQFLATKQKSYLTEYIYLYQKNWKQLEVEVDRFLKKDS